MKARAEVLKHYAPGSIVTVEIDGEPVDYQVQADGSGVPLPCRTQKSALSVAIAKAFASPVNVAGRSGGLLKVYGKGDVAAEEALARALPPMPSTRATWPRNARASRCRRSSARRCRSPLICAAGNGASRG
jgi:hypothetical protein